MHAYEQKDLVRLIDERLAENQLVIYSTPSPFRIKATALERNRINMRNVR